MVCGYGRRTRTYLGRKKPDRARKDDALRVSQRAASLIPVSVVQWIDDHRARLPHDHPGQARPPDELVAPELDEGAYVEVFIVTEGRLTGGSFLDLIDSFPAGLRSATTWEEVEARLQDDRDAWER